MNTNQLTSTIHNKNSRPTMPAIGLALIGVMALLGATACEKGSGPDGPDPQPPIQLVEELSLIGIRIDATDFGQSGRFGLGLLATDKDDNAILSGPGISVVVKFDDTTFQSSTKELEDVPKSDKPTAAAILIDDSGSMGGNDPNRERAVAAKTFWDAVLSDNTENVVGLFDFDDCGSFRTLQDFTNDTALLLSGASNIYDGGGTPLYSATQSTLRVLDASFSDSSNNRVALILTDGQPSCYESTEAETIALANALGIRLVVVGLGPASDIAGFGSTPAVVVAQNLALKTDGIYAAAEDATALKPIFESIGRASSRGHLIAYFGVSPVPLAGELVTGTATFISGGVQKEVSFSFVAPSASPLPPTGGNEFSDR